MKKRNIIIGIILILIIAVIIAIVIYNNTQNNNNVVNNDGQEVENVQTIEEGNIFLAKVISNEQNKIIIVPNEDQLIYQSFKLLNVLINNNTVITKKDSGAATIDSIQEGQTVKIEFDGKILSTNPTNIIAKNIEIQ